MMFSRKCLLTVPFPTLLLILLRLSTDRLWTLFTNRGLCNGGFYVLAGLPPQADVRTEGSRIPYTRDSVHRSTLKSVGPHAFDFLSLGDTLSSSNEPDAGSSADTTIQCTLQFEGPVSESPTVIVGPAPLPAAQFLTVLRDTNPSANGWIHGFQKGVSADSTFRFGASPGGEGEYVEVHPPSGEHIYELLILDQNYSLGPRMSALSGTPWHNRQRALGSEAELLDDIRAGNSGSSPRIVGRCSTTVSHEQVVPAQEDM